MKYCLVVLSLFLKFVFSTSSGQFITVCDAMSPLYGCSPENWINDNRLDCAETSNIMNWASKAVESENYTLSFGFDEQNPVTQYRPNELIQVHIRTINHRESWRGIMLYAVNEDEERVGEWEIPEEQPAFFQKSDGACDSTIIHASGVVKPYHIITYFRAPEQLIGDIIFRALIKQGDANTGSFYWPKDTPSGNVKLTQTNNAVPEPWFRGELGESCTDVCLSKGKLCNLQKLNEVSNANIFNEKILSFNLCKLPLLSSCLNLGPTSSEDQFCYFASTNQTCSSKNRLFQETTCEAKSDNPGYGRRWCYCDGEITSQSISQSSIATETAIETQTTVVTESQTTVETVIGTVIETDVQTTMNSNGETETAEVNVTRTQSQTQIGTISGTKSEIQSGTVEVTKSVTATVSEILATSRDEETSTDQLQPCEKNSDCDNGICLSDGFCYLEEYFSSSSKFNVGGIILGFLCLSFCFIA